MLCRRTIAKDQKNLNFGTVGSGDIKERKEENKKLGRWKGGFWCEKYEGKAEAFTMYFTYNK